MLLAGRAIAADGAFPITTSPGAAGRGGTTLAVADDAYTVSTNPAGMTNVPGTRIDLTLGFYIAQDSYTNAFNHGHMAQGFPTPAPALGYVQALGGTDRDADGPDDPGPFAFGFVLEPVSGGGGAAHFRTPVFTGGERETSNLVVLGASLGFSFRVHSRLTLGLALTGLYASLDQKGLAGGTGGSQTQGFVRNFQNGKLDTQDPFFLLNGKPTTWGSVLSAASAPNTFSSAIVDLQGAQGWGGSGTVGLLWQATDQLSIGASYKTPGFLTPLVGKAYLDASAGTSAGTSGLDAIQSDFLANHLPEGGAHIGGRFDARLSGLRMPETAGVGAAFWPIPRVLLALDLKWIDWRTAFNTIAVNLTNGNGQDLAEILSNQTGGSLRSRVLLRWHDQVVVAAGGAVAVTDWLRLRLGYNYGNDPVPGRTEGPFTPATVEHHGTIGFGVTLGPVSLDVAWVHAFPKSTTIERSGVNPDFDGIRHKADQDAFLFGGAVEF
jgi:long-chain fatty acid transport protein